MEFLIYNDDFDLTVTNLVASCEVDELATLKVSALTKEMDMCTSSFYKHFDKEFSSSGTPLDYIQSWKMFIAMEMMRKNPEISICELSKKLGYSRPDYFIRLFKLDTKCTPFQYLKKYRVKLKEKRKKDRQRQAKCRKKRKKALSHG